MSNNDLTDESGSAGWLYCTSFWGRVGLHFATFVYVHRDTVELIIAKNKDLGIA
jgi:hypothetical protein